LKSTALTLSDIVIHGQTQDKAAFFIPQAALKRELRAHPQF
jgi:hypothetical protein